MNIPFFTPKAVGSTLIGLGSMGGGGGAVYLYQMPKIWRELLVKEGYVFLNTDEEYKGMFNDQKKSENWQRESTLKDAKDNDVKTTAEKYCQEKLKGKLPSSSDSNYATTKQKLISFCTTDGIQTVKGRLIQSKQTKWIDENNGENKWKAVFAVYRYSEDFINGLKSDDAAQNSGLSRESSVDEYAKLKTACGKLLKKNYREIKDSKYFNYGSWGCVELDYETIESKIKQDDKSWSVKSQSDSDWDTLKTTWENDQKVKKWANKANGTDESTDLSADSLKKLCENSNVQSQLSDNESYQEKYLVIKAVCKSGSSAT